MSNQPEALRLAELFELESDPESQYRKAAAELRRLHEQNQELLEALEFYADKKRYEGPNQQRELGDKFTPESDCYRMDVCRDNGAIARIAIARAAINKVKGQS
jgi:hypothetical protein